MKRNVSLLALLFCWLVPTIVSAQFSVEENENITIYKSLAPGVVNISTIEVNYDFYYRPVPSESGSGSGFIIDPRGYILTNYHVITDSQQIVVTLADDTRLPAEVVGTDPNNDLAVIKISSENRKFTVLDFADSSNVVVGQKALALGNPFGLRQTLTVGIISALGRTIESNNGRKIEGVLQTDAAINRGNSGGPLLDRFGKVIGINTAIIGPGGGSVGIGFAIPSNTAQRIIPDLIAYGFVRRPWLGVESIPTLYLIKMGVDLPKGMLITKLVPNASADRANLRDARRRVIIGNSMVVPWGGDIITHIDGKTVTSFEELAQSVESKEIGETIQVKIIRDKREQTIPITLQQRPKN